MEFYCPANQYFYHLAAREQFPWPTTRIPIQDFAMLTTTIGQFNMLLLLSGSCGGIYHREQRYQCCPWYGRWIHARVIPEKREARVAGLRYFDTRNYAPFHCCSLPSPLPLKFSPSTSRTLTQSQSSRVAEPCA